MRSLPRRSLNISHMDVLEVADLEASPPVLPVLLVLDVHAVTDSSSPP